MQNPGAPGFAFEACHAVATGFPFWAPVGFNFSGFKRFGQAL